MRFRIKALDERIKRYRDQDLFEIYDFHDIVAQEPIPLMISEAVEVDNKFGSNVVRIDYPVYHNLFTLSGKKGMHDVYVEAGKKAYIRGGKYIHPKDNYICTVEEWSPYKYIVECAKVLRDRGADLSVEELIAFKKKDYDLSIFDNMTADVNYPAIDYKHNQQEGLHRAIYALEKDMNIIPVIVIKSI